MGPESIVADQPRDLVPGRPRPDVAPTSHSWRPKSLIRIAADPPEPPSMLGLFSSGYNHLVSGESEALRTWMLLAAAVAEFRAGRGVLWVDGDDVGHGALLERLTLLGATTDEVDCLFAYIRPDEPLVRSAVFDGYNR